VNAYGEARPAQATPLEAAISDPKRVAAGEREPGTVSPVVTRWELVSQLFVPHVVRRPMTEESLLHGSPSRTLSARRIVPVLGVAVVALLLLSLPSAAGASPAAAKAVVKFAPPYVGATAYDQVHHTKSGCGGSATVATAPSFNLSSGRAQWTIGSSIIACSSGTGGSVTNFVRSGVTDLNFSVATTGSYNVTAHWVVNGTFAYSFVSTANNSTGWSLSYHLAPFLCLMDYTNSTERCSSSAPYTLTSTNGSGSFGVGFSVVQLFRHAALTSGSSYGLEAYLYGFVTATSPAGPTTGSAYGALDFSSTGVPSWGGSLSHVKVFA
jgi:hypothetical protein